MWQVRRFIKRVLSVCCPWLGRALQNWYWAWRLRGVRDAAEDLLASSDKVRHGFFAGLRLHSTYCGSAFAPKIIGSYEDELEGFLKECADQAFDRVIDIGCAEGFYLVGLAVKMPGTEFHGIGINEDSFTATRALARRNGVDQQIQLTLDSNCQALADLIIGNSLVICDIEGAEAQLLDPEQVPGLNSATILVELHEFSHKGLSDTIRGRFARTHTIRNAFAATKRGRSYSCLNELSEPLADRCVDEMRIPGQEWLFMVPNSNSSAQ